MRTSLRVVTGLIVVVVAVTATPSAASAAAGRARIQSALDQAVETAGAPGIVAELRDGSASWFGSAGVSDTATGRKRQPYERFRIGSITKAFTATVVLQLAAERRLSLDDSVEHWLPGLVRGNGNDGTDITVRELLNHTSGLFAYSSDPVLFAKGVGTAWFDHRYDRYTPEQLVDIAVSHPPYFAPGTQFVYSNTDSILAALIVERVTGRSFGDELARRLLRPLALTGTYLPGNEAAIRGPHPVHYSTLFSQDPNPTIYDVTDMNQSFAWSAGGMVSTTGDLDRFFSALLGGRLLPPVQQHELLTTVSTGGGWIPDTRYGLGVFSQTLTCGVTVWGNGGATYGSWSFVMGTEDGKHMLATQINGDWSGLGLIDDVLDAEFCLGQIAR